MKFALGIFLLIGILSCENISEGTFVSLRFAALGQSDIAIEAASELGQDSDENGEIDIVNTLKVNKTLNFGS